MILLYDCEGREEETDLVMAAEYVTPQRIRHARQEAGGLLCVALSYDVAERLGLPFMVDIHNLAANQYPVLSNLDPSDIPYGDKPAFSITINHRNTFTGITDNDRALTISELAKLVQKARDSRLSDDELRKEFGANFRSPGHVHLLIACNGLTETRKGHTEYSIALSEIAGITPAMMICEMLDNHTGKALTKEAALQYARTHEAPFFEGRDVMIAYQKPHRSLLRRKPLELQSWNC